MENMDEKSKDFFCCPAYKTNKNFLCLRPVKIEEISLGFLRLKQRGPGIPKGSCGRGSTLGDCSTK
jgi:hypothetical protein